MSAAELLSRLRALGVQLRIDGGELRVSAPKGVLTAELREQLTAAKVELTELLQSPIRRLLHPQEFRMLTVTEDSVVLCAAAHLVP